MKALFETHGQIARFLMPKHGITALVDFVEPFEARKAFNRLAYSQFKAGPLYLEWAPENVFVKSKVSTEAKTEAENKAEDTDEKETLSVPAEVEDKEPNITEEKVEEDNDAPENDSTIFIKNLNFKTTEDDLREVLEFLFFFPL